MLRDAPPVLVRCESRASRGTGLEPSDGVPQHDRKGEMTMATSTIGAQVAEILSGKIETEKIVIRFEEWERRDLSPEDLATAARAMREAMVRVTLPGTPIDTCGTGGSGKPRINTSTIAAFIVAASGAKVAKHGNKAASGRCGSFDLLEALGTRIDLTPDQERKVYDALGIVFLFAPTHHPAMRHAAEARRRYGKKTLFNLLGPLCNPTGMRRQIIGTGRASDAKLVAEALEILGMERALVVTGEDGLDEVTVCASTLICTVPSGEQVNFHPHSIGLKVCSSKDIEGGDPKTNLAIARDLMAGKGSEAHRNLVLMNAAHALLLTDLAHDVKEAYELARQALDSGAVGKLLNQYIQATDDLA